MNQIIMKKAHELRFFGIHASAERRIAEAVAKNLHPADFLILLLEDEATHRKAAVSKRLETKARFRHEANLEDWDTFFERGLSKAKLQDLSCLGFLHNKEQLLIFGPTGVGKTHLAIVIGRKACHEGNSVAFFSVNMFFEEALAAKAAGKYRIWIKSTSTRDLLIFDDFALRRYTHEEGSMLLDVLEEHHKKGSIIVTSQVAAEGWVSLFDDPVLGEAIVDRMTKPKVAIAMDGPSYRDRNKEKNFGKVETVASATKKR